MNTKTAKKDKTALGKGKLCFFLLGENTTELIRDSWVSDTPKHALELAKSCGMDTEQALLVITGKKKLVGDTRVGDGTLGWEDDNTTEVSGIKLDVETMVSRLENKWVDISESINVFNSVNEDLDSEESFADTMKILNGHKNKLALVLDELIVVYKIVGKTMKDLPTDKVRSSHKIKSDYKRDNPEPEVSASYSNWKKNNFEKAVDTVMHNVQMNALNNINSDENESEEKEKKYDKDDITRPFHVSIGTGGTFYIVHTPVEKCKAEALHSGWLLPDGTFFAGDSMWIHKEILFELAEREFFKDKNYSSGEDDVTDRGGWIKMSSGVWYIWEYKHQPTKEQVEFIINYTTVVDESNTFICINNDIHIQLFAQLLDGTTQFDSYKMRDDSIALIEAEKESALNSESELEQKMASFPTVKEVSEIDPLCSPFFIPDAAFVNWLIKYANGRTIVDCGAGSGYLTALITHFGGKAIAIEPFFTLERRTFWNLKHQINFHIFHEQSQTCSIIRDLPTDKAILVFARPCHSNFVYETITKNMPKGMEALYISHKENQKLDLGDLPYTKLKHEGKSKNNEFVLSIKK